MKNVKRVFDSTGTTTEAGKINYIRNILRGGTLREIDKVASQNSGTTNANFKFI